MGLGWARTQAFITLFASGALLCFCLSACDEYDNHVCNVEYNGDFVDINGGSAGKSYKDMETSAVQTVRGKQGLVGSHEVGVPKTKAEKRVAEVNAAQAETDWRAQYAEWDKNYDKWQKEHKDSFKAFIDNKKQRAEKPGLVDGGITDPKPTSDEDLATFADSFAYPPPPRPTKVTASLDKCRQTTVSEAFNMNFFGGVSRLFSPTEKSTSFLVKVLEQAFAASGGKDQVKSFSSLELKTLAKLDASMAPYLGQLQSAKFRSSTEYGPGVFQISLTKDSGSKLSFYVDQDPVRACELLDKTISRADGSTGWALTKAGGKESAKFKHPFEGAPCSAEALKNYAFANFDTERGQKMPAITLLIAKKSSGYSFFVPSFNPKRSTEAQLHANFRAFFSPQ